MTRWHLLVPLTLLSSCLGENKSDAPKVTATPATFNSNLMDADTIPIKIGQSKINWAVTEMRGTIKRTGNIQFKSGYFLINNSGLVGGKFTVDMQTIDVTDIPMHESIAKRNLIDHLKSNDFFDAESFSTSSFEITNIDEGSGSIKVTGNLMIRDIKKTIVFTAYLENGNFKTRFTFDRIQWNIAYEGSWANKTLIDKDIELAIEIITDN